ncbi:hypothetical protein ACH5RR_010213 [Cinchona calisaya]|uniref:DUF3741 domain-containing protein n=1 Tax=Cinchona calisaya TaxID=153742 RepID=A0ABD3AHV9_9GENT
MKYYFLNYSSSSASSTITTTTATSFDSNVVNSTTTIHSGCIAGVFRRLLCLNSLPTHSSDHIKDVDRDSIVSAELDKLQCTTTKAEYRVEPSATPSIVARLMGIESLPKIDFSAIEKSPNSIARSRSMNSVDLLKELVSIQARQRRVKSFREAPTFLELEDEEFFILSFENGDESRKLEVKNRKSEVGSGQMKQRSKQEKCKTKNNKRRASVHEKNKENQEITTTLSKEKVDRSMKSRKACYSDRKIKDLSNILHPTNNSCQNSPGKKEVVKLANPINHKPQSGLRRRMKKRKDDCLVIKKIETDQSDSENSSPNSVLDIMKFPCDPEVITCSEELSRLSNSKSRRTLKEELDNYRKLNQCNDRSLTSNYASCSNEGKCVQSRKNECDGHNYVDMWVEICKMAERDTIESNWMLNKDIQKFEDNKLISGEFEIQIFDELLADFVHQLAGY